MSYQSQNPSVLIVDDNQSVLDIVRALLSRNGYNIFAALHAKEAIAILEAEHVDLIISDVMMPETDGHEFVKMVKENREWASIPIVFLTALDSLEDQFEGFVSGAEAYLTKPFRASELMNIVQQKLASRDGEVPLVKRRGVALETARVLLMSNDGERRGEIRRALKTAGFEVEATPAKPISFSRLDSEGFHLLLVQVGRGGIDEKDVMGFLSSFQLEVALVLLHEADQEVSSDAREMAYGTFPIPIEGDLLANHCRQAVGAE